MGFFVMGGRSQQFVWYFFKWPGLIAEGNKVQAFPYVPSYTLLQYPVIRRAIKLIRESRAIYLEIEFVL